MVTKHYNLASARWRWCFLAGKVTVGLVKSNGSLQPGKWLSCVGFTFLYFPLCMQTVIICNAANWWGHYCCQLVKTLLTCSVLLLSVPLPFSTPLLYQSKVKTLSRFTWKMAIKTVYAYIPVWLQWVWIELSCDVLSYCSTTYAGDYDFRVFLSTQSKETKAADWIVRSSLFLSLFLHLTHTHTHTLSENHTTDVHD